MSFSLHSLSQLNIHKVKAAPLIEEYCDELDKSNLLYLQDDNLCPSSEELAVSVDDAGEKSSVGIYEDIPTKDETSDSLLLVPVENKNTLPPNKTQNLPSWVKAFLMVTDTFTFSIILLAAASILIVLWITQFGMYPWGSDIWYHIFKGEFLYHSIKSDNLYPLYTNLWYNGVEPLRYWAPLPHYILAFIMMLTQRNALLSYNIFVGVEFFIGGLGWLIWGRKTDRRKLSIVLALLWFFLPDNIHVLFAEGNVSRVFITALFPYLLLNIWSYMETKKLRNIIFVIPIMSVITLCHAMICAMVGITIFLFTAIYGFSQKKIREMFELNIAAVLGITVSGIWLYPAVKGSATSMDQSQLIDLLTYHMSASLNPISIKSRNDFYFGLSIFIISFLGIIFSSKVCKSGFCVTLMIFIGTTKLLVPVLRKLPMGQMLWMIRFTPLAMGMFFMSLILWKTLNKKVLAIFLLLIILDSYVSFHLFARNVNISPQIKSTLDNAIDTTENKVALLDLSKFGSLPSYYLSYNSKGKQIQQVFGSGWQAAQTSQNVVCINTAFEKEHYSFIFDRCLEQGADTVVLKKDEVKDLNLLYEDAKKCGYQQTATTDISLIFKYPVTGNFATKVKYKGLAVGKYSVNAAYIYPEFEISKSEYIDDYTESELLNYSVVFLSGFKFHNRQNAESLVRKVSEQGTKFVIDLTNVESDAYSSRPTFLGVVAEPVKFVYKFPDFNVYNKNLTTRSFPSEYSDWSTIYLNNLDQVYGTTEFQNQYLNFLGAKVNNNISFIGFNIPYYALETNDQAALELLDTVIGLERDKAPERKVVNMDITNDQNSITIKSSEDNVMTNIAYLESFSVKEGDFEKKHNLIYMKDHELTINIVYPHFKGAIILTLAGIFGVICFLLYLTGKLTFINKLLMKIEEKVK